MDRYILCIDRILHVSSDFSTELQEMSVWQVTDQLTNDCNTSLQVMLLMTSLASTENTVICSCQESRLCVLALNDQVLK